jgi:hypothetical protein
MRKRGLPSIWGNAQIFPHICGLWRPLIIYDLQLLHSEFPFIWGKFDFLFYQCTYLRLKSTHMFCRPQICLIKFHSFCWSFNKNLLMSAKLTCIWQGVEITWNFPGFLWSGFGNICPFSEGKLDIFHFYLYSLKAPFLKITDFFVFIVPCNNNYTILINIDFVYFFGELECVGQSFAYVTHFVFLRYVWSEISTSFLS